MKKAKHNHSVELHAQPLLVDSRVAAKLLGISREYFLQLDRSGRVPKGTRLGRRKLFSIKGLQQWVDDGCPERE